MRTVVPEGRCGICRIKDFYPKTSSVESVVVVVGVVEVIGGPHTSSFIAKDFILAQNVTYSSTIVVLVKGNQILEELYRICLCINCL